MKKTNQKLTLKKNIVAQLGKEHASRAIGKGTVPTVLTPYINPDSFQCVSGPCHTSQAVNCLSQKLDCTIG